MPSQTHCDLVARGRSWLRRKGCAIVFTELYALTTTGELPDVIGWKSGFSILIEAKATRADFLSDKKKPFRKDPTLGMGNWRFFLTPPGVVEPSDVPEGWGLLWALPRTIKCVHGGPRHDWDWYSEQPFEGNSDIERVFLLSALRRLQLHHGVPRLDELIHATYAEKAKATKEPTWTK